MRAEAFAIVVLALVTAAGCTGEPVGSSGTPRITFTPPVVINPGAGGSETISARVTGARSGARLRWTSLNPEVVVVEATRDERKAVLHFAVQRSAAVELAVIEPEGWVAASDTLRIGSVSAIAPDVAAGR